MKHRFFSFLFVVSSLYVFAAGQKPTTKYSIKVRLNGLKDTVCYLAYHFGDKQYLKDTAVVDSKGNMVFEGKEKLLGGIYLVVLPNKSSFEFLVPNEQAFFSFETDTSKMIENMKVSGSKENELFFGFLNFLAKKTKESDPFLEGYKRNKDKNKDSASYFQSKLGEVDKEVKAHRMKIVNENPGTLISKIFSASTELEIPETPILPDGKKDSTFAYRWMKIHYFDNVDFSDERLLRTPILHSKMKYYLDNLTPPAPDSIKRSVDFIISKTEANKEVFKFFVWNITSTYETSNIMGMDAIFVHMAENYYLSGKAFWIDSTIKNKIRERYVTLKPLLIGKKVPNISLPDTSNNFHDLYGMNKKFTVLYFWDPHCGHCQKETPKLNDFYNDPKNKDIGIFAVGTDHPDDWKKFVKEKNLLFLNVCNAAGENTVYYDLRKMYDVYSTPTIYILDEKKEIIGKKLSVDNINDFLEDYNKMMEYRRKNKAEKF